MKKSIFAGMFAALSAFPLMAGEEPFVRYVGAGSTQEDPRTLVCEIHNPTDAPFSVIRPDSSDGDHCYTLFFADDEGKVEASAGEVKAYVYGEAPEATALMIPAHGKAEVRLHVSQEIWDLCGGGDRIRGIRYTHTPPNPVWSADIKKTSTPEEIGALTQEVPMEDQEKVLAGLSAEPWARFEPYCTPFGGWFRVEKVLDDVLFCDLEWGSGVSHGMKTTLVRNHGERDFKLTKYTRSFNGEPDAPVQLPAPQPEGAWSAAGDSLLLVFPLSGRPNRFGMGYDLFIRQGDAYLPWVTVCSHKPVCGMDVEAGALVIHAEDGSDIRLALQTGRYSVPLDGGGFGMPVFIMKNIGRKDGAVSYSVIDQRDGSVPRIAHIGAFGGGKPRIVEVQPWGVFIRGGEEFLLIRKEAGGMFGTVDLATLCRGVLQGSSDPQDGKTWNGQKEEGRVYFTFSASGPGAVQNFVMSISPALDVRVEGAGVK